MYVQCNSPVSIPDITTLLLHIKITWSLRQRCTQKSLVNVPQQLSRQYSRTRSKQSLCWKCGPLMASNAEIQLTVLAQWITCFPPPATLHFLFMCLESLRPQSIRQTRAPPALAVLVRADYTLYPLPYYVCAAKPSCTCARFIYNKLKSSQRATGRLSYTWSGGLECIVVAKWHSDLSAKWPRLQTVAKWTLWCDHVERVLMDITHSSNV